MVYSLGKDITGKSRLTQKGRKEGGSWNLAQAGTAGNTRPVLPVCAPRHCRRFRPGTAGLPVGCWFEFMAGTAGVSGPALPAFHLQRAEKQGGINTPLHLPWKVAQTLRSSSSIAEPPRTPKSPDLLPQPPKSLVLWRIEGEDPDLHPH